MTMTSSSGRDDLSLMSYEDASGTTSDVHVSISSVEASDDSGSCFVVIDSGAEEGDSKDETETSILVEILRNPGENEGEEAEASMSDTFAVHNSFDLPWEESSREEHWVLEIAMTFKMQNDREKIQRKVWVTLNRELDRKVDAYKLRHFAREMPIGDVFHSLNASVEIFPCVWCGSMRAFDELCQWNPFEVKSEDVWNLLLIIPYCTLLTRLMPNGDVPINDARWQVLALLISRSCVACLEKLTQDSPGQDFTKSSYQLPLQIHPRDTLSDSLPFREATVVIETGFCAHRPA